MVVPKTGGCCGGAPRAAPKKAVKPSAPKKPAAASKPAQRLSAPAKPSAVSSSTTPTRKNDDALKKRLKNILEKANVTTSTSKTSTGNSNTSESKNIQDLLLTSDVQKFILNAAKKEANATTAKGAKKVDSSQPKKVTQSNTKTTKTGTTSAGTTKKSSSSSCAGGSCSLVKKAKATSTIQKANCKSTVKKSITGGKTTAVITKKVAAKKRTSCCNPNGGECSFDCSSSSCDCGCGYSTETDDSEDDDDDESSESSSFDESDSFDDNDDGDCCKGRSCGRMNGKGKRRNQRKRRQSSGSWDTLSDSGDGKGHSKKCKIDWHCESLNSPIDTSIDPNENSWDCEELKAPLQPTEHKLDDVMSYDRTNENSIKTNDKRNKQAKPTLANKVDKVDVNGDMPRKLNGQKNRLKTKTTMKADVNNQPKLKKDKLAEPELVLSGDFTLHKKKKLKSNGDDFNPNFSGVTAGQNKSNEMSLVPYEEKNGNGFDSDSSNDYIVDIRSGDISTSSSDYTYDEEEDEDEESDFEYDTGEDTWEELDSEDYEYSDEDEEESESESSSNSGYDSDEDSVDGDYQLPEGVEEDILIRRGEANIYDATDDVRFDSDDSSPQIFELPNDEDKSSINKDTPRPNGVNDTIGSVNQNIQEESDSNDSCPQLVPIDFSNDFAEDLDYMDYSSIDNYSDLSEESEDPPNMEPEIIEADFADPNISQGNSFFGNNNFLETTFESETDTGPIDTHKNPVDLFMQKNCDPSNYKIISIPNNKFDRHSRNSRRKTPDESISPSNISSGSACRNESRKRNKSSSSTDVFAPFDEMDKNESAMAEPPQSKFYNSLTSYQVLLLLKSPISFHGTLKITLVAGRTDIFGYKATVGETLEAFSPRGNNLLSLTPLPSTVTNAAKTELEKQIASFKRDFLQTDLHEILQEYDPRSNAIVLLERNNYSKRVHMVKKFMKEDIFPGANVSKSSQFYQSEFILHCRFHTRYFNNLYISPQWNSISLKNTTKLLIIGGKGVGKSTFLRYTINNNFHQYKQFVLIDLDIGQPEVFAPQTISVTLIEKPILGPGHYYGITPDKCYLHGDINVVLSPQSYILKVKELLKYCQHENKFKNIPWVINTMGYNKGFGPELLSVIIEHLQPTDVVQLHSLKQFDNFEFPMNADAVRTIPRNMYIDEEPRNIANYKLHIFESVAPIRKAERFSDWQMSSMEVRLTMVVSMLGSLLSEREEWLTDVRPYRVSADDVNIIYLGEETLTKEELLEVINVNIVYLCNNSTPAIECYGIGLVRGVDKYQRAIYLLPSIPPQTLINVNTIAVCNNPLPASFLLNQGPKIKGPVPYTYNTNDLIATKHVPQKVYRPQHYLQGTRNVLLNE